MRSTSKRLVVLTVAALLGMTACGGGNGPRESGLTKSHLVNDTPAGTEPVDSITWGLPAGEPTSIDPITVGAASEMTVVANMCENLLSLQPDFSVEPGIAQKATYADDTTLVLDLRDDVAFWNGNPLTADDVVYSLQRAADPEGPSYYASGFRNVTSIQKTGPLQVTLRLSQPDAQLYNSLAGPAGAVVEKGFVKEAGKAFGTADGGVMCTGPYQFVSWKTGNSITMKANPKYWNGAPKVGQITFQFVGDTATLTTALKAGELDGAYDLPVATAVALDKAKTGTVFRGSSTSSLSFGPTTDEGPAADPRVREALDVAIYKKALIASVLRGLGTPQKTFVGPLAFSGDPAAAIYQKAYDALPDNSEPDLDRARQLVKEAGAEGAHLVMAIPAGSTTETQAATAVQDAAKDIGLDLELKTLQPTEFSELFYNTDRRADLDFVCTIGYQDVPGPLYYAPEFATPEGLYNWSHYSNPEVTAYLEASRDTTDREVSAENYVKAQEIFANDRLQVTLAGMDSLLYLRDGLTGAPASIAYISSPWALHLGGTS